MSEDIERIAAGLTKAQREAVISAAFRKRQSAWWPAGWYLNADRRVRWNLCCAKLVGDYLGPWQRLTPLGLRVRQHLLETQS